MSGEPPRTDKKQANLPARLLSLVTSPNGIGRFVRFAVVGASGVFVDMPIFWALVSLAHVLDLVAILPAYFTATMWNFMLNDRWTFGDRREQTGNSMLVRLGKYLVVSLPPLAYRLAAYWPLKELSGVQYLLAYAIAIVVGMLWNFGMSFFWTWRKRSHHTLEG